MAKRFTDSDKWDDPWFLDLPNGHKLLWIFILDKCNHAGIFKVSKRSIDFHLETETDLEEIKKVFKKRIHIINEQKWFITKFIEYQYGELQKNNRVHNSVIQLLKKEGVFKVYQQTLIGAKDKDIYKDKDKVKDKVNGVFSFEDFWKTYPHRNNKKIGKKECREWWVKNANSAELRGQIKIGVEEYRRDKLRIPDPEEFIASAPDPIRFLRRNIWKDYYDAKLEQEKKIDKTERWIKTDLFPASPCECGGSFFYYQKYKGQISTDERIPKCDKCGGGYNYPKVNNKEKQKIKDFDMKRI